MGCQLQVHFSVTPYHLLTYNLILCDHFPYFFATRCSIPESTKIDACGQVYHLNSISILITTQCLNVKGENTSDLLKKSQ